MAPGGKGQNLRPSFRNNPAKYQKDQLFQHFGAAKTPAPGVKFPDSRQVEMRQDQMRRFKCCKFICGGLRQDFLQLGGTVDLFPQVSLAVA